MLTNLLVARVLIKSQNPHKKTGACVEEGFEESGGVLVPGGWIHYGNGASLADKGLQTV